MSLGKVLLTTSQFAEQIDLVFWIGATLVVGEIKCTRDPLEPLERFNVRKVLKGAACQARRKVNRIESALCAFCKEIGLSPEPDEVLPVVVTILVYGTGMSFGGVPVVDPLILNRYFGDGDFYMAASLDEGGNPSGHRVAFYNGSEQAHQRLSSLQKPPQIAFYKAMLKRAPKVYPWFDNEDSPFFSADFELGKALFQALADTHPAFKETAEGRH